jgi:hypothetical protein
MNFFISEHCKIERTEGDVAVVTVRVPLKDLDSVIDLVNHIFHAARWLRTRSKAYENLGVIRSRVGSR